MWSQNPSIDKHLHRQNLSISWWTNADVKMKYEIPEISADIIQLKTKKPNADLWTYNTIEKTMTMTHWIWRLSKFHLLFHNALSFDHLDLLYFFFRYYYLLCWNRNFRFQNSFRIRATGSLLLPHRLVKSCFLIHEQTLTLVKHCLLLQHSEDYPHRLWTAWLCESQHVAVIKTNVNKQKLKTHLKVQLTLWCTPKMNQSASSPYIRLRTDKFPSHFLSRSSATWYRTDTVPSVP